MERTFRKPQEDVYPQKIYASQLITVDDLLQFKKQLLVELVAELKSQINIVPKKWLKSHEVRRLLKISPALYRPLKLPAFFPIQRWAAYIFLIMKKYKKF